MIRHPLEHDATEAALRDERHDSPLCEVTLQSGRPVSVEKTIVDRKRRGRKKNLVPFRAA
jgi:hypothetical protein